MLKNIFTVFVVVIVFFDIINGQGSVNSGLNVGDVCVFNETIKGVCSEIDKCDYIIENAKNRQISDEFKKNNCLNGKTRSFVCCPFVLQPQDIQLTTRQESNFEQATCVNREPEIDLGINIVGGQLAGVSEYPFQATIGYKSNKDIQIVFKCGGSLISNDVVITSADCLRIPGFKPTIVKVGATSLSYDSSDYSTPEDIEIRDTIPHPKFSIINRANNIGLIKLKRSIEDNKNIQTICLSIREENLPQNFTITGHRLRGKISDWLLKGTSVISPHDQFSDQLHVRGYKDSETCFGDFGGPLFYYIDFKNTGKLTYLHGIKTEDCNSTLFSTYTKISPYLEWIKNTMDSWEAGNSNVPIF